MAVEAYFGSNHQLRNQLFEDNTSTITYHDEYLSTNGGTSLQGLSLNFSNSVEQLPYENLQHVLGNINIDILSDQTNSGTSFDESSLITGVNSLLYGGSYSQGLGINHVESPASISGSSYSLTGDQLSDQGEWGELHSPISVPQFSGPSHHASVSTMMMCKKPRLETVEEALCQAMQLKCYNDCVLTSRMFQQQQSPCQQQYVPNSNNIYTQPLLHAAVQPHQAANTVLNVDLAVRKLMSYVHYRRQRPPDNNIAYWRSFVKYLYSPHVQRRTCFSNYSHIGRHAHGAFALMETWKCELCGSTSGKGFVETFDVLPRMNQLYFSRDVVDELLYLDISTEKRLPDGSLILCFEKAVLETIYVDCRVVHEGKLQVTFTPQLKIISWDFCVQHHEVFLPSRFIASQVNDFVKSATKCRSEADAKGHCRVKGQGLPSNSHSCRVAAAGRKLAMTLEQPNVSDLGFSRHFVRNLQVFEVFNVMKGLMTYSLNHNSSPIETLKLYGRKHTNAKYETRHIKCGSPQTPGPCNPRNVPAHNVPLTGKADHTSQTMNYMSPKTPVSNGKAVYISPSLHQKFPVAEQMTPDMYTSSYNTELSYYSSYLSPVSPAQNPLGPFSTRESPTVEQFMLNDLLAHLQKERTKEARHKNARGKCNVTNDPNGEDDVHIGHGGTQKKRRHNMIDRFHMNNELAVTQILSGKTENGKGFNSSSSSNQDCNFIKKDIDLEEDFTSPSQA